VTAGPLPFVSVIVPVRNGERMIRECIVSLLRADYPVERREILVVDNGSTDHTSEILADLPVRYLREERRGVSHARNRGIEASQGEILAFTDADCVVTTGWLRELVQAFDGEEIWGVAGEILAFPPRTPAERYTATRKGLWQRPALESRSGPFAITANVAFKRETFARIGLFDPAFIKAQDKDFGWRFFRAGGMKLAYNPKAVTLHRHRPTGWALFKQHVGWGYGGGLLHTKYQLPWTLRQELAKYQELLSALRALADAGGRYAVRHGDKRELQHAYFEVLRRLAHRLGALGWMLKERRARAPSVRSLVHDE
jgi:glycosyltransferase involved in cell wall biosynthesis